MAKITIWTKIKEGKPRIDSETSRARYHEFLKAREGKDVKLVLEDREKSKSEEALGFLFGALYTSIVAHNRNLVRRGQIENNPLILGELSKAKKITSEMIEDTHRTYMFELRPVMVYGKDGKPHKEGDTLRDKPNKFLIAYISEVMELMTAQGYEIPNNETYLKFLDEAQLK